MTFLIPVDNLMRGIDTGSVLEYTCNYMVNKLEITIKKRSG